MFTLNRIPLRIYSFFIVFAILLSSCTSNTIMNKPDDLIPKNEMIEIMTEVYLANASYNVRNKYQERQRNYMSLVFEKYGVDSARYNRSNLYYMSRIDEYEKMHVKVSEKIKKMKTEKDAEFRVYDSIKRSKNQ
jgi:hypothetical protein